MRTFFHNNKKWLMYGTLFSALTFTISGTNPTTAGSVSLSAELPAQEAIASEASKEAAPTGNKRKPFPLRRLDIAAKAIEAPQTVEKVTESLPEVKKASLESAPPAKDGTFEDTKTINGKQYEFTFIRKGENTKVIWSLKDTEALECSSGDCLRESGVRTLKGDVTKNFSDMVSHIEKNYLSKAEQKTAKIEKEEEEVEEISKGQRLLESINTTCDKSKEVASQIECKVDKFISYLNKVREITENEALDFFNDSLKDGLKEMLTHKFSMLVSYNNTYYDNYSAMLDLNEEKRAAQKEKDTAVKLVKNLLKSIGAKYKDVRKEASKLYNDSVTDQAKEALLNYRDMKLAEKNKDVVGQRYNMGSFLMNDEFLRSLDRDLFAGISGGLYDSKSMMENSYFNQIMRELNNSHAGICITYSKEIGQSAEGCGSVTGGFNNDLLNMNGTNSINTQINNALRNSGRGTNQMNSVSVGNQNGVRILVNGAVQNSGTSNNISGSQNNRLVPVRGN